MQGWLHKQSKYLKVWRKRWTVIDYNQLVCYKEQTQITSTLTLNTKDIIFIESDNDKKYLFNIYVDTNSDKEDCYCFECESKTSMNEWTSFIWSVLKNNLNKYPKKNNNKNRMVAFSSVLINQSLYISDIISSPDQPHTMSVLCYDANMAIYLVSIEHEKLKQKILLFKLDNEQYDLYNTLQITSNMKYIAVCNTEETIVTIFNVNDGTIHHQYHPITSHPDWTEKIMKISFLTNQFIVIEYVQKVLKANHYFLEKWEKYKYESVCKIYNINDSQKVSTLIQEIESYDHIRTSKHTNKELYARKYRNYNSKQNYMIINSSLKTNALYPLDTLDSSLNVDMSNIWLLDHIVSPNGRYSVTVYMRWRQSGESYVQIHDLSNLLMDNASRRYCNCIYAKIYDFDIRDCAVFWLNNRTLIIWQMTAICNKELKGNKMFCKGIQIRYDSCIPPLIEGIMAIYDIGDSFANIIAQIVWIYLKDDDDIIPSIKYLEFNDSIIMRNIHGDGKWTNNWTININKNVTVYQRNGKLKVIRYDF